MQRRTGDWSIASLSHVGCMLTFNNVDLLVTSTLAPGGKMQIGLLSAVPGAPLLVGAIVSWNLIVMTMIPAYLIAHIKPSAVKLGVAGGDGA